jgi:hypothetical protein
MLSWWRRRKERQQQVLRDADNLIALFGERAYFEALARASYDDEDERNSRGCCGGHCPRWLCDDMAHEPLERL